GRARLRACAGRQPRFDPGDGEDRDDVRRPLDLSRTRGGRVRGPAARDLTALGPGEAPVMRPSQAVQRTEGCALRCRGRPAWGTRQSWVRDGTVPGRPGRV